MTKRQIFIDTGTKGISVRAGYRKGSFMSESDCPVASFVRDRIAQIGKSQKDIAKEVGFEKQNVITMIKQGKTKLPMAKIGLMAKALDTDTLWLLKLCLSTYQRDSWEVLKPTFDTLVTEQERVLLEVWRNYVGTPSITALSGKSKGLFHQFLDSVRQDNKFI